MTTNPVELVYQSGVPVSKADVIGYEKLRVRLRVANPDEIRNTDFSGQFGGLYVATLNADFNIDTTDTTTADDGVNCIRDSEGNGFFRVAVSTVTEVEKVITADGDVTISDSESADNVLINNTSGAAINVYLPSAVDRQKRIKVVDVAGNAGTYNITILPKLASGQTIMTGSSYILDVNGMGIDLRPRASGAGYY